MKCYFVSDLHGQLHRYSNLFSLILQEPPDFMFFGGDLFPHRLRVVEGYEDFARDYLFKEFRKLKNILGTNYPEIFLILGNDDPRSEERKIMEAEADGLINYIHGKIIRVNGYSIMGYSFVPPTPFQLKDWEKFDVSRYLEPGCIHPGEGFRTAEPEYDPEYATIQKDLESLAKDLYLDHAICMFHSPPYKTALDRAALDNIIIDHVPADVHVGSIAIQRFIESKQPRITLHGHIHESTRLTGSWIQQTGNTFSYNAAHDGPELSVIVFDTNDPGSAIRLLK